MTINIDANAVKELRQKTNAGIMDCKKALQESNGEIAGAEEWLRKQGLSRASSKSGRMTAEGIVAVAHTEDQTKAVVIELNCETDFVARNEKFIELAKNLASQAINFDEDAEAFLHHKVDSMTVHEHINNTIVVLGENITLRRISSMKAQDGKGVVFSYIHNAAAPGAGKIAAMVQLNTVVSPNNESLKQLGKKLAMHVAAANPAAFSISDLDANLIQKEKEIFSEQAKQSGKPDNVIEKMVEGRVHKFYEEVVLLEQAFALDGKTKVSTMVENTAKEIGSEVKLAGFIRYMVGEGIKE